MKAFNIILLQIFGLVLFASAQNTKSYFDANAYHHTINYDDHKIVFQVIPADQAVGEIDLDKKYTWYSSNQIRITQGGFSGKLLHGGYSDYYLNKNLREQGLYYKGLKTGLWKNWLENGILESTVTYAAGVATGRFKKYDASGQLSEEGKYSNGVVNGRLKKYVGKDSVQLVKYKDGKIVPQKVAVSPQKESKLSGWIKSIFSKKNKNKTKQK